MYLRNVSRENHTEFTMFTLKMYYYYYSKSIIIILHTKMKSKNYTKKITSKKYSNEKSLSELVPKSASVLGMRLRHITATSTRAVSPLLSRPPATRSSPLGSSVHAQDDRGQGKSPTLLQL